MIATQTQSKHSYTWTQRTASAAYAPRDGARGVVVGSRLYLLGGWDPSNSAFTAGAWPAGTTNEVWYSDNRGVTWSQLLTQDPATTTRWKPRHEFGCLHFGGYVYVVGGDSNSGTCQTDVWRAPDSDLTSWTRMAADWGCGNRVLYSCWERSGSIYVAGGQTIASLVGGGIDTYFSDVWASTNNGATFTQLATSVPLASHNACGSVNYQGQTWFVAGGKYKAQFARGVHSTLDGVTFTAHPDGPFDKRYYTDCALFDGKLWLYGGYADTSQYSEAGGADISGLTGFNRGDCWYTNNGDSWQRYTPTEATGTTPPLSHASTVYGLPDGLIIAAGNHLTRQVWELHVTP